MNSWAVLRSRCHSHTIAARCHLSGRSTASNGEGRLTSLADLFVHPAQLDVEERLQGADVLGP
ncbi:hypothetical protein, partial [Streptomyces chryseus]